MSQHYPGKYPANFTRIVRMSIFYQIVLSGSGTFLIVLKGVGIKHGWGDKT